MAKFLDMTGLRHFLGKLDGKFSKKQDKQDDSLVTTAKTIVEAINEVATKQPNLRPLVAKLNMLTHSWGWEDLLEGDMMGGGGESPLLAGFYMSYVDKVDGGLDEVPGCDARHPAFGISMHSILSDFDDSSFQLAACRGRVFIRTAGIKEGGIEYSGTGKWQELITRTTIPYNVEDVPTKYSSGFFIDKKLVRPFIRVGIDKEEYPYGFDLVYDGDDESGELFYRHVANEVGDPVRILDEDNCGEYIKKYVPAFGYGWKNIVANDALWFNGKLTVPLLGETWYRIAWNNADGLNNPTGIFQIVVQSATTQEEIGSGLHSATVFTAMKSMQSSIMQVNVLSNNFSYYAGLKAIRLAYKDKEKGEAFLEVCLKNGDVDTLLDVTIKSIDSLYWNPMTPVAVTADMLTGLKTKEYPTTRGSSFEKISVFGKTKDDILLGDGGTVERDAFMDKPNGSDQQYLDGTGIPKDFCHLPVLIEPYNNTFGEWKFLCIEKGGNYAVYQIQGRFTNKEITNVIAIPPATWMDNNPLLFLYLDTSKTFIEIEVGNDGNNIVFANAGTTFLSDVNISATALFTAGIKKLGSNYWFYTNLSNEYPVSISSMFISVLAYVPLTLAYAENHDTETIVE